MEIKVPLLQNPAGLGDLVKAATSAVGIKPCSPCEERRKKFNKALTFAPSWSYPNVPEGWTKKGFSAGSAKALGLYEREGTWMIWEIINERYRHSYTFPKFERSEQMARDKYEELCRQQQI